MGSRCGVVFMLIRATLLWGEGDESLVAWATVAASHRVVKRVVQKPAIVGKSWGQRFENMRIRVDLQSK